MDNKNMINQQQPNSENFNNFRNGSSIFSGGVGTIGGGSNVPPPLPPRVTHQNRSYQPYGMGYGNTQTGYGYSSPWNYRNSGMGGYGMYGSYGGYSQMYPGGMYASGYSNQPGGPSGDIEDRFIQYAEESSRPAFQSIESVVRTFSSISMLLESTHFAITNSFRAILSVAENIGKTRYMFTEITSAFALTRFFKWLYKKIMYIVGLNPEDPSTELVWRETAAEMMNERGPGTSAWPIVVFLSLLVAIPCLLNKIMSSTQQRRANGEDPRRWFRCNEPVYSAVALYDFEPGNRDELRIKCGQKIWLAPQSLQPKDLPGWSRASNDRGGVGLVPTNYVKIVGQLEKKPDPNHATQTPSLSLPASHSLDSSTISGLENARQSSEKQCDESTGSTLESS